MDDNEADRRAHKAIDDANAAMLTTDFSKLPAWAEMYHAIATIVGKRNGERIEDAVRRVVVDRNAAMEELQFWREGNRESAESLSVVRSLSTADPPVVAPYGAAERSEPMSDREFRVKTFAILRKTSRDWRVGQHMRELFAEWSKQHGAR